MSKKTHICFIVPNYPTKEEPVFTFVRQLIVEIADLGIKCSVIAPVSISKNIIRKTHSREKYWEDITNKGNVIEIYQPRMVSFSNVKLFGYNVSSYLNYLAIKKTFKKLKTVPDVLYGHFWDNGLFAAVIGKEYNIPTFVATGESKINIHKKFPRSVLDKYLPNIDGVIAVSSKNKKESIELGLAKDNIIEVIHNAINNDLFYPINKSEARERLGINKDVFIVAFTGGFIHRKGVLRLSDAIENVKNVQAIYIGSGNLKPNKKNALYIGSLPHEKVRLYLNSADVFVLPTLAEGASNAIIEAMACGLPIISSNRSFNDDILYPDNSIRIDPMNIEEIKEAIILLRDNYKLREAMSKSSVKHAKSFNIEDRAKKILEFINKSIML